MDPEAPSPAPMAAALAAEPGPGGGILVPFGGRRPLLGKGVFLAPNSSVIGNAKLGEGASVWFAAVVRADIARIEIGAGTNIQDGGVVHVADDCPCILGARVVVGHMAVVHGCRIGDETLIGMGAIVLNGVSVGEGSIVAAGSLVTEGTTIPPRSMVMGTPGRVVREVTEAEIASTIHYAEKYTRLAREYLAALGRED